MTDMRCAIGDRRFAIHDTGYKMQRRLENPGSRIQDRGFPIKAIPSVNHIGIKSSMI